MGLPVCPRALLTWAPAVQAADGTLQLQSGATPLPDQALRWLRPLHRPPLASSLPHTGTDAATTPQQPLEQQSAHQTSGPAPEATDTVMESAEATPGAATHQPGEASQADRLVPPADGAISAPAVAQQPAGAAAVGGAPEVDAMQVDSPPVAAQAAALVEHAAELSMQSIQQPQASHRPAQDQQQQQQEQQLLEQPQLQHGQSQLQPQLQQGQSQLQQEQLPLQHQQQYLPSLPQDLQERVRQNVAKCDRQLLARQEALMAKLLPQRIEEEVRAKHGVADIDDSAVAFVQQVGSRTPVRLLSATSHEALIGT